ncbi:MAG TPA: FadR/GntR family transcriptional regulator [Aggregatilineales bacterium]|jgi:GntR family transcriptional repressor for pyruvate dehydrogenase complex|nr:FadR/GntR family transcriptional regulator [Aggregatilineales bacterium]
MKMASRQETKLLYEHVVNHIRKELLDGNLKPGSQLPTVASLAEQLEVGHAAVREAYRLLESRGILEVTQGRGTFVSAHMVDIDGLMQSFQLVDQPSRVHLLEARRLLEPGIAALAAIRANDADLRRINGLADIGTDPMPTQAEYQEINIQFHDAIVTAVRNPVLKQMLTAIYDLIRDTSPAVADYMPNAIPKAISSHKLIALAIQERDPDAARVLMYQHIRGMEERLLLATQSHVEADPTAPKL